jgi:hypothetical protein
MRSRCREDGALSDTVSLNETALGGRGTESRTLLRSRAVGLLQFAFEELAGLGAEHLLDEVDGTGALKCANRSRT